MLQEQSKKHKPTNQKQDIQKDQVLESVSSSIIKITSTKTFLQKIPQDAGVYMFLDTNKQVLYIGKAKNLKSRITSYFVSHNLADKHTLKTHQMLKKAKFIKLLVTVSEFDAFLLEATLIKLFKPKYNIQLKDDKTYPYIALQKIFVSPVQSNKTVQSTIQSMNQSAIQSINQSAIQSINQSTKSQTPTKPLFYYKIFLTRNTNLKHTLYFGPYPDVQVAKKAIRILKRLFPIPSCSKTKFMTQARKNRACLYGQIGICPAPCVNQQAFNITIQNAKHIIKLLKHGYSGYIQKLKTKMIKLSKQEKFEQAIKYRNIINTISALSAQTLLKEFSAQDFVISQDLYMLRVQNIKNIFLYNLHNQSVLTKTNFAKALNSTQKTFHLPRQEIDKTIIDFANNLRIEAYDMSTMFLQNSTASMVVSINGQIAKNEFKRFKIKTTNPKSDFDMFKEVFTRRLTHIEWGIPNLLLLDGGKPQVSTVIKTLQHFANISITKSSTNKTDYKIQTQQLFAQFLLNHIPIWGIYKPFDFFVAYLPQIKQVFNQEFDQKVNQQVNQQFNPQLKQQTTNTKSSTNFDLYIQHLKQQKELSIRITKNWLFILPKRFNPGLQHLRNLRDHAHDFAKNYHKKLRSVIKSS